MTDSYPTRNGDGRQHDLLQEMAIVDDMTLRNIRRSTVTVSVDRYQYVTTGGKKELEDLITRFRDLKLTRGVFGKGLDPVKGQYEKKHYEVKRSLTTAVDACQDKFSGNFFCLKQKRKQDFKGTEELFMMRLQHKNIPVLFGLIHRASFDGVNMESYYEDIGVPLKKCVPVKDKLKVTNLMKQGCDVLNYLHIRQITLVKITPESFSIRHTNGEDILMLVSLEYAREGDLRNGAAELNNIFVPEYSSPEICQQVLQIKERKTGTHIEITSQSDDYSFALVMIFMILGCHGLVKYITNGADVYSSDEQRMSVISKVAHEKELINELFQYIPEEWKKCHVKLCQCIIGLADYYPKIRWTTAKCLKCLEPPKYSKAGRKRKGEENGPPYKNETKVSLRGLLGTGGHGEKRARTDLEHNCPDKPAFPGKCDDVNTGTEHCCADRRALPGKCDIENDVNTRTKHGCADGRALPGKPPEAINQCSEIAITKTTQVTTIWPEEQLNMNDNIFNQPEPSFPLLEIETASGTGVQTEQPKMDGDGGRCCERIPDICVPVANSQGGILSPSPTLQEMDALGIAVDFFDNLNAEDVFVDEQMDQYDISMKDRGSLETPNIVNMIQKRKETQTNNEDQVDLLQEAIVQSIGSLPEGNL